MKVQSRCAVLVTAVALAFAPTIHAQSLNEAPAVAPSIQTIYAGGVSYNAGASPAIAGTGLFAHQLNSAGSYAFTAIDALPNTYKPFTVSTNVGIGVAQKVATIAGVDIFVPTAAGISFNGTNTGWQWNAGALAAIHIKGNYYLMPNARFLKSSVSGGTGYQPILGILFAYGK